MKSSSEREKSLAGRAGRGGGFSFRRRKLLSQDRQRGEKRAFERAERAAENSGGDGTLGTGAKTHVQRCVQGCVFLASFARRCFACRAGFGQMSCCRTDPLVCTQPFSLRPPTQMTTTTTSSTSTWAEKTSERHQRRTHSHQRQCTYNGGNSSVYLLSIKRCLPSHRTRFLAYLATWLLPSSLQACPPRTKKSKSSDLWAPSNGRTKGSECHAMPYAVASRTHRSKALDIEHV